MIRRAPWGALIFNHQSIEHICLFNQLLDHHGHKLCIFNSVTCSAFIIVDNGLIWRERASVKLNLEASRETFFLREKRLLLLKKKEPQPLLYVSGVIPLRIAWSNHKDKS